jgi:choline monooxygenase
MERDNDSPADPEAPASAPTGKACGASAVDSAVDPTPSHGRDTALLDPQPQATARALPAACYVEPHFATLDRERVFARGWYLVGHAAQVAQAGSTLTAEIGGVPLLLTRGDDGALRALHNVCRHRAGPLACEPARAAQPGAAGAASCAFELVCQYHGWRYALDGRLRGAPEMGRAQDFDIGAISLPQARVAQWQGLVFAALDEHAGPFDALVAGIDARLGPAHPLASYRHRLHVGYDIGCDWKVYVDNYLEGYHVPRVHPGLNAALDYRSYTTELSTLHSLQASPLDSSETLYGKGEALYWWLWPTTMLNCLPGRLQTNRVIPRGPGRCRVEFDFFYAPGAEARAEADAAFSDEVQREDIGICEAVQRGLASGSYTPGRLNPLRESGLWHFHELLRAAWRAA